MDTEKNKKISTYNRVEIVGKLSKMNVIEKENSIIISLRITQFNFSNKTYHNFYCSRIYSKEMADDADKFSKSLVLKNNYKIIGKLVDLGNFRYAINILEIYEVVK